MPEETGTATVAAVDLGASSGRVVLARVGPGTLELTETGRFDNGPVRLPSGLHWDLLALYAGVLEGLREAGRQLAGTGEDLASIGIDSWAVDYALLAGERGVGLTHHYRDERRGEVGPARVHEQISREELYSRTGLQFLPFNTVYQLAAEDKGVLATADRLLLVPDLLASWLTGVQVTESTNASTTGLLDPRTGAWDGGLMDRLALPRTLFTDLVAPGERIGSLTPEVQEQTGLGEVPVVAVGSHDTASAVVGVPLAGEGAAYLSLGTWGLVGLELPAPVLTDAAREANFTNEGGVDGTTRFLTNVMGTWMLSEAQRVWEESGEASQLADLLAAAAEVPVGTVPVIDVQDPRFAPPGDMPARIEQWCAEHDVTPPQGRGAVVRCILVSLAAAYAHALEDAARLTDRSISTVHVVGGPARNELLCQAIADATGCEVVAGPVEATAIGNVLVQARAAGVVGPTLSDLRAVVRETQDLRTFAPHGQG
ncbi:Rhamnulokinase [Serinicoccus hydrothermalis]|uniref:Rhamnulokinase n=1 Tax=Serinicoccus hydrothermalis TaxID=1758689 RepID=A0A1B1NE77_9MICO|nr:rhamnulokinase family protein [Serinicoccus hydrothermalis]ANS79726.1 Rhamnulokinase [Serinicoccus hydrothermalis]